MKFSPKYNKLQHYLIEHVYMYMNISYMNKCTLNKNREWREEWERGVGGDGVWGYSLDEPRRQQETFQTTLYIQTRA